MVDIASVSWVSPLLGARSVAALGIKHCDQPEELFQQTAAQSFSDSERRSKATVDLFMTRNQKKAGGADCARIQFVLRSC
jgi:hypothetical protein